MPRKYCYLRGVSDSDKGFIFSAESTGKAIEAKFPGCATATAHYAQVAFDAAHETADNDDLSLEYQYLFFLARKLMAATRAECRREKNIASRLAPYALVYLEALTWLDCAPEDGDLLDWEDDEQVLEYFEATYGKTKFAADENLPEFVMNQAKARPLRIKGLRPRMLSLLSFAYHLQKIQGDEDILLPVETLGNLLECSPAFVSQLLANARKKGYVNVTGRYVKGISATPYKFDFSRLTKGEFPKTS